MSIKHFQTEQKYNRWIVILSIGIPLAVAALFTIRIPNVPRLGFLPPIYATINAITAVLLVVAVLQVKKGNRQLHEWLMKAAIACSVLFLLLYIAYHATADATKFGDVDHNGIVSAVEKEMVGRMRYLYYFILFSHILLSIAVIPLVLITYVRALATRFDHHKKIAKITFPIWLYVAITGVLVYVLIAPYYVS